MTLTPRFQNAFALASDIHVNQTRKGSQIPYTAHLMAVSAIVLQFGGKEDEAIAGLLHDAIEDAPADLRVEGVRRLIRTRFGEAVLRIVEGCSDAEARPDQEKPPWRERKEAYIARVVSEPAPVILVSAADKLHNGTAILSDFRHLGDALWERFNPAAGMAGTVGYYRGLVTAYQTSTHHPRLVGELARVVSELESATGHKGQWPL